MLVTGVDSSTQPTKVVLFLAQDGVIVGQGSAPHPGGTRCDPNAWRDTLRQAGAGLLERAALSAGRRRIDARRSRPTTSCTAGASQSA